ncbi:MAG: hypothetical protein QY314_02960 [Candidatus Dojkabacteria bacterium]|nr:MAG: hypothetical protein QY314_02960 [Candidatus Dojkabacteria bacterium]
MDTPTIPQDSSSVSPVAPAAPSQTPTSLKTNQDKTKLYLLIFGCVALLSIAIVTAAVILRPQGDNGNSGSNTSSENNTNQAGESGQQGNSGNSAEVTPRPTLPAGWSFTQPQGSQLHIATPVLSTDIKRVDESTGYYKWQALFVEKWWINPIDVFSKNTATYVIAYHNSANGEENRWEPNELGSGAMYHDGEGYYIYYTKDPVPGHTLDSIYEKIKAEFRTSGAQYEFTNKGKETIFNREGLRIQIRDTAIEPEPTAHTVYYSLDAIVLYYQDRIFLVEPKSADVAKNYPGLTIIPSAIFEQVRQIKEVSYFE